MSQGELGKIVGLSRYRISLYEKEGVPENKRQIFMDVLNDDYMLVTSKWLLANAQSVRK